MRQLRADGTKIPKASQHRPSTPPMDANTRRDHDDQSGAMISLAEEAAQEDAAIKTLEAMGTEAGSASTKVSMVQEKVRSV